MSTELSLTYFLLARLAEREVIAKAAVDTERAGTHWHWVTTETDTPVVPGQEELALQEESLSLRTVEEYPVSWHEDITLPAFIIYSEDGSGRPEALRHIAQHDPAYVLADIEAKRWIVEDHARHRGDCDRDYQTGTLPCDTVLYLALPYADHPDYREEWKP